MGAKETVLIVVAILVALVLAAVFMGSGESSLSQNHLSDYLFISSMGRVGSYGYVNVNYSGNQLVKLLAYQEKPRENIFIIKDQGIGNQKTNLFIDAMKSLEKYGYTVNVVPSFSTLVPGTYIVPTGAMPIIFLENAKNQDDITIIYYGKKDLLIDEGIKKIDWYSVLDEKNRQKFVINEIMPDDLTLDSSLLGYIAESNWSLKSKQTFSLHGNGVRTLVVNSSNATFIRFISTNGSSYLVKDYVDPNPQQISLGFTEIFPSENAVIYLSLPKTNGTASFIVEKDGKAVKTEELKRVTEEQLFREDLSPSDSGTYILKVVDNRGIIGGGILHVKEVTITFSSASGRFYTFNATIDGIPIRSDKVLVSLNNGSEKKIYIINDGSIIIPAQLKKGKNTFNFVIFDHPYHAEVENNYESILDVYIKYGTPGSIIVILVFLLAKFSRRPTYTIRVGNTPNEVRKEVKLTVENTMAAFRNTPAYLGVSEPITAREFSLSLKKFATEGADVTEGNVEELLQQLMRIEVIENHKNYYQVKSSRDVKKNYLLRVIREKLISCGVNFTVFGDGIKTKDFEIGFPGTKFSGKGVMVFEDDREIKKFQTTLSDAQLAQLRLKQNNGLISLVTLDSLDELL